MAERKAVIKNADMSEDMQQDAVDCASTALEKYNIEKVVLFKCFFCSIKIIFFPPSKNIYCRILLHISKKSSTKSITPHGIA